MQKDKRELDLKEYLLEYYGSKVDFYRFPGNYGDSLIYHGSIALMKELNIKPNLVYIKSKISNDILVVDGGGNFVDEYNDIYNFLKQKHKYYKKIIIFPHTIKGRRQYDLISTFSKNTTIFCREKRTFNSLVKIKTKAIIYLWHDCAFYNKIIEHKNGIGVLNAFRTDIESNRLKIPLKNNDISSHGWCRKPLTNLLCVIRKYKKVKTDRLHIAIAGALLGKEIYLYPNSYYKNKSVYDYSLKRYNNVTFKKGN